MMEFIVYALCCGLLALPYVFAIYLIKGSPRGHGKAKEEYNSNLSAVDSRMLAYGISPDFDITHNYKNSSGEMTVRYVYDATESVVFITYNSLHVEAEGKRNYWRNRFLEYLIKGEDLIDCKISADDEVLGGSGGALAGAVLFGTTGAIIGSTAGKKNVTRLTLSIVTADVRNPAVRLDLINAPLETNSASYHRAIEFAENVQASIMAILNSKK